MDSIIDAGTLLLIVVGWLVTYRLEKNKELEINRLDNQKNHVDIQLAQLYGPIYGLLLENDRVRHQVQMQFGRTTVFESESPLSKYEERIWVHYLENYFLPNNRKIIDLIQRNVHLLQGVKFPKSWITFIDYAMGYEIYHKQYKDLGAEYGFCYIENFPTDFRQDVVEMVSSLKKKQKELVGQNLPSPYRANQKTT